MTTTGNHTTPSEMFTLFLHQCPTGSTLRWKSPMDLHFQVPLGPLRAKAIRVVLFTQSKHKQGKPHQGALHPIKEECSRGKPDPRPSRNKRAGAALNRRAQLSVCCMDHSPGNNCGGPLPYRESLTEPQHSSSHPTGATMAQMHNHPFACAAPCLAEK